MPVRNSPYFNSPAVAAIAGNLSSLFEPPSGADAAGWATARSKQEEAARLAQLFDLAQAQEFDQQRFDRMGAAAGQWTPNQSYYAVDKEDATQRYGYDQSFRASTENNVRDNTRALEDRRMQEAAAMDRQNASPVILNQGQRAYLPAQTVEATDLMQILEGAPKPLSETEWTAQQNQRLLDNGRLTDTDLLDAIMGDKAPVKAVDPRTNQPSFMTPGAATRTGAQPYEAASAERVDNYLAVGPDGQEIRFPGIVGPDGRIVNANTGQVVPNVIRKEGTGGGMSFEADGQGGVRFTTGGTGNTVSQQTQLQGQRDAAARSARELQTLFDNISASDVGVAGNFNELLTNYGAQIWPEVARGDVTSMRAQMTATTMGLARSLAGDSRISDTDRRMAQEVMAGKGLGESLPGARAKIAALTVLHAYREKFAGALAEGGQALPPINRAVVGQLVDDGVISPALAQTYVETMLSSSRDGPTQVPGMDRLQPQQPAQAPASPQSPPPGVDPADWEFLTPEERELFR